MSDVMQTDSHLSRTKKQEQEQLDCDDWCQTKEKRQEVVQYF